MTTPTDKLIVDNLWRDISEAPHNVVLLVKYTNLCGKERREKAIYFPANSCVAQDSDFGEYDDEADEYYCPAGWYVDVPESIGYDFGYTPIEEPPTHFRPLPDDRCANALRVAVEALIVVKRETEEEDIMDIVLEALAEINRITKKE